jgi:uncharacterized protein (TIGR02588 family)
MAKHARRPDIPPLEWVFAVIGVMLVAGAAAFITWHGFTRGSSPPDVSLRVDGVSQVRNGYVVTLRAKNAGATTAKSMKVQGDLTRGGVVVESAEMSFDYLPPDSERKGGLMFTRDPRQYEVKLTAKGYEVP